MGLFSQKYHQWRTQHQPVVQNEDEADSVEDSGLVTGAGAVVAAVDVVGDAAGAGAIRRATRNGCR